MFLLTSHITDLNCFVCVCVFMFSFLEHVRDDEGSCVSSEEMGPAGHTPISALINDAYEVCVCGTNHKLTSI